MQIFALRFYESVRIDKRLEESECSRGRTFRAKFGRDRRNFTLRSRKYFKSSSTNMAKRMVVHELEACLTIVILEKGNCRLEHRRFVHLPTVGRHHRAELVDEIVELIAALFLAEIPRLSFRVVLVIVVIHLKVIVASHLSQFDTQKRGRKILPRWAISLSFC